MVGTYDPPWLGGNTEVCSLGIMELGSILEKRVIPLIVYANFLIAEIFSILHSPFGSLLKQYC